jgi:Domain of unknown function (DUF222)/HNH endonuclease
VRYLRVVFDQAIEAVLEVQRPRDLAEELRLLLRRRDQLALQASRLAGELDRIGFGEAMGSISTVDWIRHECQLGYQAAADLICVGREMDSLAESVAAVEQAQIGFQHLVLIARTRRALGDSALWRQAIEGTPAGEPAAEPATEPATEPAAEPAGLSGEPAKPAPRQLAEAHLLAEAREASVSRFRHLCEEARHAADPAGVAREQARAMEARTLRLNRQQDGFVTLSGILDPIGGAAVKAALEPLARPSGRHDGRRRERRLADALIELSQHSMDRATPRQRPHLNVTATLGTLYMNPGSAAAEMDHGDPVSGVTVGRIACDCSIRRHIFDSASLLVGLGPRKRVVSAQLRKALEARDRHCRWPGCTRPGSWCEAHHVVPWTRGGATNQDNRLLLCSRHHVQVHEGRWQLLVDPDGHVEVIKPPLDLAAPPRGPASSKAA